MSAFKHTLVIYILAWLAVVNCQITESTENGQIPQSPSSDNLSGDLIPVPTEPEQVVSSTQRILEAQNRNDNFESLESTTEKYFHESPKTPTILQEAHGDPWATGLPPPSSFPYQEGYGQPPQPQDPFNFPVGGIRPMNWLGHPGLRGNNPLFKAQGGLFMGHHNKGFGNPDVNSAVGYAGGVGHGHPHGGGQKAGGFGHGHPHGGGHKTGGFLGLHHGNKGRHNKMRFINPVQMIMTKFMLKNAFVQRVREVKDDYRRKEYERRVTKFSDNSGDLMTKGIRSLLQKLINKYEKNTATIAMIVEYRKEKLKYFLDIPLVQSILSSPLPSSTPPVGDPGQEEEGHENQGQNSNPGEDSIKASHLAGGYFTKREGNEDLIPGGVNKLLSPIMDIGRKFLKFVEDVMN